MTKIRNYDKINTPICFSGTELVGGKIYPTDIDGFIEINNRCFIIIEMKEYGCYMPTGQRMAFERVADTLARAKENNRACVLQIEHTPLQKGEKAISMAKGTVTRRYEGGEWVTEKCSYAEMINRLGKKWKCSKLRIPQT